MDRPEDIGGEVAQVSRQFFSEERWNSTATTFEQFALQLRGLKRRLAVPSSKQEVSRGIKGGIRKLQAVASLLALFSPRRRSLGGAYTDQIDTTITQLGKVSKEIRLMSKKIRELEDKTTTKPPDRFMCPILMQLMENPVAMMVEDTDRKRGLLRRRRLKADTPTRYDRSSVKDEVESPITRRPIVKLRVDEDLKQEIEEWKADHPDYGKGEED